MTRLAPYLLAIAAIVAVLVAYRQGEAHGYHRAQINTLKSIDDFHNSIRRRGKAMLKRPEHEGVSGYAYGERGCRDHYHRRRWPYVCPQWPDDYTDAGTPRPEPDYYPVIGGEPIAKEEL